MPFETLIFKSFYFSKKKKKKRVNILHYQMQNYDELYLINEFHVLIQFLFLHLTSAFYNYHNKRHLDSVISSLKRIKNIKKD